MIEGYRGQGNEDVTLSDAERANLEQLATREIELMDANEQPLTPDAIISKLIESGPELSPEAKAYLRSFLGETL